MKITDDLRTRSPYLGTHSVQVAEAMLAESERHPPVLAERARMVIDGAQMTMMACLKRRCSPGIAFLLVYPVHPRPPQRN